MSQPSTSINVKIRITMETEDHHLKAEGHIYRELENASLVLVHSNVDVRRVKEASRTCTPGDHQYRYRLSNGDGKYKLFAYVAGENVPFATTGEWDGKNHVGNIFEFKVPSPKPSTGGGS
jgi:hypothetical protein